MQAAGFEHAVQADDVGLQQPVDEVGVVRARGQVDDRVGAGEGAVGDARGVDRAADEAAAEERCYGRRRRDDVDADDLVCDLSGAGDM